MTLDELKIGEYGLVVNVGGEGALRQHLLDMGIVPAQKIKIEKYAPMGDPIEIIISGYSLTLRLDDAKKIEVKIIDESEYIGDIVNKDINCFKDVEHPGLGEAGIHHDKKQENYVNDGLLTFALVGNQNCGKTTLFNQLTGANQHVGNFPGVTVDKKSGPILNYKNTLVTDLPGIYSMSPYSIEENISRDFVLNEKPKCIINILDVTNLERNLYLTMQLLELDIPIVTALNMMDEFTSNGGSIDVNLLESLLGTPVVPISALKNKGVVELVEHAIHIAKYNEKPIYRDFCDKNDNSGAVHRCIHAVMHLIEDHCEMYKIPIKFVASKLVEGDKQIEDRLKLTQNEKETISHIIIQMEEERGLDRHAAMADMRYKYIRDLTNMTIKKPKVSKEKKRSAIIDNLLTGKYTAIPMFILIMVAIFYLTFNLIGPVLQDILEMGISNISDALLSFMEINNVNIVLKGLVIDGILAGVGSVVSFLPIIVLLFFFLSLLEDTGYLARVAFFMDKLLRKIGLSGRSIVPLLIGFGCTVPAIMSTRTLPSERDRKMTILLTPFMSCTAKLPIYAFFVNAFFKKQSALMISGIYFLGIIMAVIISYIYRVTLSKGEAVPFVMELPNYRLPSAKNTLQLLWEKAKDFLQKAFSIILVATVVVWFLQSFDYRFNLVTDSSKSIMANISSFIAPIFAPIGIGEWRVCTSLISGFMAKESVVSTIEILFGGESSMRLFFNNAQVISLLVFSLLYTPCVASIAAVKRELGFKWAMFMILWQCVIAYFVSFVAYNIALMFI